MSLQGKTQFLRDKDQNNYINTILRRSIESTKLAIKDNIKLMEIEFLPNRKNDISVVETLDTSRDFVRQFVNSFKEYGKNLWLIFPDNKELQIARKKFGDNTFFTMTSIEGSMKSRQDIEIPKLCIAITPGFNIEEWINLANWDTNKCPLLVINGNLDRLRQGYYPGIFYPNLAKVSTNFYKNAVQIFFIQPVSVSGDRFAGYTARVYPDDWETLIKSDTNYEVIKSSKNQDKANIVFDILSKAYKEKYNKLF
jgi:hypothetical protein